MLESSRSFQLLAAEDQYELRNSYSDATDKQLLQAIDVLRKDALEAAENEKKMREFQMRAIKMAKDLQATLKKIEMDEIKERSNIEHAKSSKAADKLLEGLDDTEKKDEEKPEKKKFLGIF